MIAVQGLTCAWLKVGTRSRLEILTRLSDCLGYSFVLRPSSLVPVSALEGHQKLAGRAAMTFPELTLRSAGGGCAGGPRLRL